MCVYVVCVYLLQANLSVCMYQDAPHIYTHRRANPILLLIHPHTYTPTLTQALRERRMRVCHEDFVKAKEKTLYRKKGNIPEGLYL